MNELLQKIGFSKYKSFDSDFDTFELDADSNISLIIGRNNSGKSSVIDVVEKAFNSKSQLIVNNLYYSVSLDDQHIKTGFSDRISGGDIAGNHYLYGKGFIGKNLNISYSGSYAVKSHVQNSYMSDYDQWHKVAHSYSNEITRFSFRRINADRDVIPEVENDDETVSQNGDGATNIIRKYLNYANYDEKIVEQTLLNELNIIMGPDATFTGLKVQQIESLNSSNEFEKKWEIFIEESGKRYALSKSGSGLKTIILILVNLFIVPKMKEYRSKEIVYAFEEVENNLHPALQRRLFEYLYDYSINNKRRVFLTSHSHVAINTFYGKESVSIYHVTKNSGISSITKILNDQSKLNILDDLDVKASDMFQSNGIIWVEGPSDRVYLKRWLDVFCHNDLIEGRDYQFAYYGGKLLAHYTSEEKKAKTDELIDVLKINRNAAIVIDSDKMNKNGRLNDTKRRIRDEFGKMGYFCWITKGKEIENYVSCDAVNQVYDSSLKQIKQFAVFPKYIKRNDSSFVSHKVDSARKFCEFITEANSTHILDLKDQITKLYRTIKSW